jgi:hypothetical protein
MHLSEKFQRFSGELKNLVKDLRRGQKIFARGLKIGINRTKRQE